MLTIPEHHHHHRHHHRHHHHRCRIFSRHKNIYLGFPRCLSTGLNNCVPAQSQLPLNDRNELEPDSEFNVRICNVVYVGTYRQGFFPTQYRQRAVLFGGGASRKMRAVL